MVWSGTKEGRKEEVGVEVGRGESKGRGGSKTEERRSESRLRRVLLIPSMRTFLSQLNQVCYEGISFQQE